KVNHNLYDDEDLMERAAALLGIEAQETPILLYGFYNFTPLQRRFLEAALRECEALAFFPWRAGTAYEYATPTLTWLTSLGFQSSSLTTAQAEENKLTYLQKHLFEERPTDYVAFTPKTDSSVRFLSAPGEYREAREIGRRILELV